MADVIRLSISDPKVLNSLSKKDIRIVSREAMDLLAGSDIRGFIYSCFTNQAHDKGLVLVNEILKYAENDEDIGKDQASAEIVEAAIGTLSILSESNPALKTKVFEVLDHDNPSIVAAAVGNLGNSTNLDNFKKVCGLLLREEFTVSLSAAKYIEACTRDAAFRGRSDKYAIPNVAENFLRNALVPLESAYQTLKKCESGVENIQKRIALLVAMIYNEILDSTDWKRIQNEQVEERIYNNLEQHLGESIGPDALPFLFKLLTRSDVEKGIKRSALNTLGRMSKQDAYSEEIISWLPGFMLSEKSEELLEIAETIHESYHSGKTFSSVPPMPTAEERSSIIPRTVSATHKTEE
ncbi:MAG: hypothetical protein GY854_06045 [Deltaproteobacteria bacterium]|nr:hypothetical protein [Deltaproteobacteria bacterium]